MQSFNSWQHASYVEPGKAADSKVALWLLEPFRLLFSWWWSNTLDCTDWYVSFATWIKSSSTGQYRGIVCNKNNRSRDTSNRTVSRWYDTGLLLVLTVVDVGAAAGDDAAGIIIFDADVEDDSGNIGFLRVIDKWIAIVGSRYALCLQLCWNFHLWEMTCRRFRGDGQCIPASSSHVEMNIIYIYNIYNACRHAKAVFYVAFGAAK